MKKINTVHVFTSLARSFKYGGAVFVIGCIYLLAVKVYHSHLPEPSNDQDLIVYGVWLTLGIVVNFIVALVVFFMTFFIRLSLAIHRAKKGV